MNYKKLRDDTLKVVFKELYYRDYIGLEYDSEDNIIKNIINNNILEIMLSDKNSKIESSVFSTDINKLNHENPSLEEYANLYAIYRLIEYKYKSKFANNMKNMLALCITNKVITNKIIEDVNIDYYSGGYQKCIK